MSKINDETVYALTAMVDGGTVIGSLPNGNTVQFTISGIIDYVTGKLDFVHYDKATKAGQTIMGNDPDDASTYIATINNGNKFIGTIKVFPPTLDAHINFITRIIPR